MFRTLLLATLAASTSFACTIENAEPANEGPVATSDVELLRIDGADLSGSIKVTSTVRQRFDFVLTENDSRTCASFTKVTPSGSWRGFSTFPTAPWPINTKRCAAVYTPNVYGGTATIDQLGLSCREFQTARERWCSNYGNTCGAPTIVMEPATKTWMAATAIPSDCPVEPRDSVAVIEGTMYARTYTGGCTSCGTISGGMLYLNSPSSGGFVTYDVGGTPYIIGFSGLTGPVTYDLGSWASGPVMVSY